MEGHIIQLPFSGSEKVAEIARCYGWTITEGSIVVNMKRTRYEAFKEFVEANVRASLRPGILAQGLAITEAKRRDMEARIKQLPYGDKIDKYQIDDIADMYYRRCNLLLYDMGLGKSITSAILSELDDRGDTLVVGPSVAKWNWYEELIDSKKWNFDSFRFSVLDAQSNRQVHGIGDRMYILVNQDILERKMAAIRSMDITHIIIDEAHNFKNTDSQRTALMKSLVDYFPRARLTIMTGTPVKNRAIDMFSYLRMMRHPLGSSHKSFLGRFCRLSGGRGGKILGNKNAGELRTLILNDIFRRLTDDTIYLPPMTPSRVYIPIEEHRAEYSEKMRAVVEKNLEYRRISDEIKRLRVDYNGEDKDALISQAKSRRSQINVEVKGNLHSLNKLTAMTKIKRTIEFAENIISHGEKVVIFSGYTDPIKSLAQHFGDRCVVVDGSVPTRKRKILENRFKQDPGCQVFIGNMVAAGVAINLVNARVVIHTSLPLTPDEVSQATKRVHRRGQTRNSYVYYMLVQESIDETLLDLIEAKQLDINALLDGGSGLSFKVEDKLVAEIMKQFKQINKAA